VFFSDKIILGVKYVPNGTTWVKETKMFRSLLTFFLVWGILFLISVQDIYSADGQIPEHELKKNAPKVYLDSTRCDKDYIRTEIVWVNYVRDRKEADVHILGTLQRTGSGGWEYTFEFIGQKDFSDLKHTLTYASNGTDTWDEIRQGYVEVLKRGLFPYILHSPIAKYITIGFKQTFDPTSVEDKWNFWVFNVGVNGSLSGEKKQKFGSINGHLSANRVTPELKMRFGASGNFNESHFEIDGSSITSTSEREYANGMIVKSIGDHWAAGGWVMLRSSTYNNLRAEFITAPAVEYNLFPYAESTRRQLRFLYRIGYSYSRYREETIYDKTEQHLLWQALNVTLEVKEPWGIAATYLEGSNYFHDFKKNRVELGGHLSLRLIKGLALNVSAGYSRIHDQLSLAKGEVSLDEILLQRKELETDYSYHVSLGFSYTFGSVYSNVVNPRFGH
jgi:hypothetical protein